MKHFLTALLLLFSICFADGHFDNPCSQKRACNIAFSNSEGDFQNNSIFTCRCSDSVHCPDGWTGDNIFRWKQRYSWPHPQGFLTYHYKLCNALNITDRPCVGVEPAVKTSWMRYGTWRNYPRLDGYYCRCSGNDPLVLRMRWMTGTTQHFTLICPENEVTCRPTQRCVARYYDARRGANVTKTRCKCPSGYQCDGLSSGTGWCKTPITTTTILPTTTTTTTMTP